MAIKYIQDVFPKTYYGHEEEYSYFDGTKIINIDRVKDIPNDYYGWMGVPVTFLDFYNKSICPFRIFSLLRLKVGGGVQICALFNTTYDRGGMERSYE